jgi:ATP-dependent RNA helicase DeaD
MIERLNWKAEGVRALVLTPTRELAIQVKNDINSFAKYTPLRAAAIYGGVSIERQIRTIRKGVQIIVGTPGRIIQHLRRRTLTLKRVKIVVLDEADKMFDMGFIADIEYILNQTPRRKQISLWSATIDARTKKLSKRYMHKADEILVSRDEIALKEIDQRYLRVSNYDKLEILVKLIEHMQIDRAIIFCKTGNRVEKLSNQLRNQGYNSEATHGRLRQERREQVLEDFRNRRLNLMVATEVAARGLDIEDVPYIINYDIPRDPHMYFHRIGRTARAGKFGTAITFITKEEDEKFRKILAMTTIPIRKMKLPPKS